MLSPLFNITHDENGDGNSTSFVFTLPIDPKMFTEIGKVSEPCAGQAVSCEWQDPTTLEFLQSGCSVTKEMVDMGSGVVGTQCTCTHLTVFALVLRTNMQLAPLCQAKAVDYVLIVLYALLIVCLVLQPARGHYDLSLSSVAQHLLLMLACVLRIVYLVLKPVIDSLPVLVLLGLLPSAVALSLFTYLLLTWASVQFAKFENSPFHRFRVLFTLVTLLVLLLIVALTIAVDVVQRQEQEQEVGREAAIAVLVDGSYVLATLYLVTCLLVVVLGVGLRRTLAAGAFSGNSWISALRHRVLVTVVSLSACLFLVACLWVAAVQTDIVTSSALTLVTTTCFYVFDWLSLCLVTWLFVKAVGDAVVRSRPEHSIDWPSPLKERL